MARGKNYINNNRGLYLQSGINQKTGSGKKNPQMMQLCEYGAGCTRNDCVYRHEESDGNGNSSGQVPVCVLFLAGKCSFKDKGCRKRHPSKEEVARLLLRYKKTRCRFGDDCYTDSCLFLHPRDKKDQDPVAFIQPHHFPPLCPGPGLSLTAGVKPVPNSAWNSAPVGVQGKVDEVKDVELLDIVPSEQPYPVRRQHEEWRYPPSGSGIPTHQQHQHMHTMMMPPPPPQQYYGGPPQVLDPNTGYLLDPSYYDQQTQHYNAGGGGNVTMYNVPHGGMPFSPYGIPMNMPAEMAMQFNAEAKEFVPDGSTV